MAEVVGGVLVVVGFVVMEVEMKRIRAALCLMGTKFRTGALRRKLGDAVRVSVRTVSPVQTSRGATFEVNIVENRFWVDRGSDEY